MGSLNSVHLIGRLTRDPEVRTFQNGGKVAEFGLAVDNRKKDQQTGQWVNDPVFLNLKGFDSQYKKTASLIEQYLRKGALVFIEGRLTVESWDDKQTGAKRQAVKVIVNDVQFLEKKSDSQARQGGDSRGQAQPPDQDGGYAPPPDGGGSPPDSITF